MQSLSVAQIVGGDRKARDLGGYKREAKAFNLLFRRVVQWKKWPEKIDRTREGSLGRV